MYFLKAICLPAERPPAQPLTLPLIAAAAHFVTEVRSEQFQRFQEMTSKHLCFLSAFPDSHFVSGLGPVS